MRQKWRKVSHRNRNALVMPMTETTTADRTKRQPKPDKVRKVADDVVTPNSLATHLGMTRQNVARLTAEAVLVQRSDHCYDQSANRLRYIKDPETGFYNSCHAGTHAVGPRRGLVSFVTPHSHIVMGKYREMGAEYMPIAFVFGGPPAYEIMANFYRLIRALSKALWPRDILE